MNIIRLNRREIIASMGGLIGFIIAKPSLAATFAAESSDLENALLALCEAVLPVETTDDLEIPGAMSAGAHLVLEDKRLEIWTKVPREIQRLNASCFFRYGRTFEKLPPEKREQALDKIAHTRAAIHQMIMLIKESYYSAAISPIGQNALGYPELDNATPTPQQEQTWREQTKDGNL